MGQVGIQTAKNPGQWLVNGHFVRETSGPSFLAQWGSLWGQSERRRNTGALPSPDTSARFITAHVGWLQLPGGSGTGSAKPEPSAHTPRAPDPRAVSAVRCHGGGLPGHPQSPRPTQHVASPTDPRWSSLVGEGKRLAQGHKVNGWQMGTQILYFPSKRLFSSPCTHRSTRSI